MVRVEPRFEAMYGAEFDRVFRATTLLTGSRTLAEEATQEAFARCLERWHRLRDQPWVVGWVMATALNAARRSRRRAARTLARETVDEAPTAVAEADRVEAAADLWAGIRALPLRQQQAVVLHYAVDLPVAEVASAMGCDEGTVKSHLARGRQSLRRRLAPIEQTEGTDRER
jgi:RNA polymerase sigma-70 factor, ECF subfamily